MIHPPPLLLIKNTRHYVTCFVNLRYIKALTAAFAMNTQFHGSQIRMLTTINQPTSLDAPLVLADNVSVLVAAALASNKAPHWIAAMNRRMQSLNANSNWTLDPWPSTQSMVSCKWILRSKYNTDGIINRYKERLVARGFTEKHGVDFEETFSPTLGLSTFWVLMALGAH